MASHIVRDRPPVGIRRLLQLSEATTWEVAQTEWVLTGHEQREEQPDFIGHCELCRQPNVKALFELQNQVTGHVLWVGSECIIRWRVLNGDGSIADNRRVWHRLQARRRDERRMREFGDTSILTAAMVSRYRQAVRRYFAGEWDGTGPIPPQIWAQIVRLATGQPPEASPAVVLDRIRQALLNPRLLNIRFTPRDHDAPELPRTATGHVWTTLAIGEHTRDPSRVIE